jgi:hypothetical protein
MSSPISRETGQVRISTPVLRRALLESLAPAKTGNASQLAGPLRGVPRGDPPRACASGCNFPFQLQFR